MNCLQTHHKSFEAIATTADEAEEEESSALPIDLMADNLKLMLDMDGESEEAAAMEAHGEAAAAEEPQEPHQELRPAPPPAPAGKSGKICAAFPP